MSPADPYARPDTTGSQPLGTSTPSDGSRVGTYFLGRYRVVDEIGIGGMASVHLGRMDGPGGFQKWVAIKRIHPHLIEDDSFVQMFLDEARVAARISHPNVATVFELGKHDDSYWIAMEYLHGEPLRELMRRTEEIGQTMPPEIACRIIADAAEGLHAAHELTGKNGERLNLVHRDVTPHNLFVTYDGTTKVVDFGIAKFSSRMSSTRAGTLKGKLAYMSPEQVHGEQIDRRTDIFALGVVLWELTTGQRLFRMESDLDTLAKVQECNVPRPSTLVRGYPIDLEKIVMRALAKNRGERFKTAREMSRALQGLLMRRGLFIASDEVAAYVQSIFQERIQKREAHLRWAAEVTQTINIDRPDLGLAAPAESSIRSVDSNGRSVSARPAAGMRPTMQGLGAPNAPSAMGPDPSRHAPTVRPPAQSDGGFGRPPAAAQSGSFPKENDEEFDDQDATVVTTAPTDLGRQPATARLGESGETAAMTPQVIHKGGNPFATTMDARNMQMMQTQQEFHAVGQGGLGMNLMGAKSPGSASNISDSLPMTQLPLNQIPNPYSNPAMNPSASQPRILLAPLEFGSPDNRTITARALRRGTPLWVVAVGSAVAAVLLLAALYLIVTHASSPTPGKTVASASGTPSSSATITAGSTAVAGGPFAAARTSFAHAIEPVVPPVPTTSATPQPLPFATAAATTAAANDTTPAPTATATTVSHASAPSQPAHNGPTRVSSSSSDGTGLLTIVCTPSCDQVIDNGKLLGPAPIFRLKVTVGEHHLQLKNGKVTKIQNAIVTAGDLKSVVVPM